MKRNFLVIKDKRNRNLFKKYEKRKLLYRFFQKNLPPKQSIYFTKKLNRLPRNSSITRIKNRCIMTGRGRSIYSKFRLSRMQLRELSSFAEILNLKQSSW